MGRRLMTKMVLVAPVVFLVTLGVSAMVHLIPGDAAVAVAGPEASPETYEAIREQLGLNLPFWEQYMNWLGGAVHLDFGRNLVPPTEDVTARLARAFPVNLELMVMALALSLLIAVPLAVASAARPNSRFDRVVSTATFSVLSVPNFLAAILLILALSVGWSLLPSSGWARPTEDGWGENLQHALLPAIALALPEAAVMARLLRSDMISTLQENYILAAQAKGMPRRHVLLREALRPSSFSLVTVAGISIGRLIGGSLVVEQVFSLPGLGSTIVNAARLKDFPIVQAGVLLIAIFYIIANFVVDLIYLYIDPRIRRARI